MICFQWNQPSAINQCKWTSVASAFQIKEHGQHCVQNVFASVRAIHYHTISHVAMFSDCRGLITQELKASKMLTLTWRVAYQKDSNATWQIFRRTTTVSLQFLLPGVFQ